MLLAEPFFSTSILPWHDLAFMYLRSSLSSLLSKDCVVLPRGASVMAAPGSYVYRCACVLVRVCACLFAEMLTTRRSRSWRRIFAAHAFASCEVSSCRHVA